MSQYKNIKSLEDIQRRTTKMVKGLEAKMYEGWLRSFCCSAWRRGDWGKTSWQSTASSQGELRGRHRSLLSDDSNRTWGNNMELSQGRVRSSVRKRLFTRGWSGTGTTLEQALQGRGHWTKLLEFKDCLNNTLLWSYFGVVVCGARSLTDPYGFFPTRDIIWFCDIFNITQKSIYQVRGKCQNG